MNNKDKVEKYMTEIRQYITSEYGNIPAGYNFQLDLLKENLELYFEVKDHLNRTGIFDMNRGLKNPLLSTLKDLSAIIYKIASGFGLSVLAKSKIKMPETDDSLDFIDSLTK